jgi:nucleotide-sensitive chloride channel 1A
MSKRNRNVAAVHLLFSALPPQAAPLGLDVAAGEAVSLSLPSTLLHAAGSDVGEGTLWVTNQRVAWTPASGSGGLYLEYPRIALHAVCRDPAAFPRPCLYCQVAAGTAAAAEVGGGLGGGSDGGDEGGESEGAGASGSGDVFFAPADPASLEALFSAMTAAAELHPDAEPEDEGEGGGLGAGLGWMAALMGEAGDDAGEEAVEGQFADA